VIGSFQTDVRFQFRRAFPKSGTGVPNYAAEFAFTRALS
jgi:hypothetical protein